MIGKKEMTQNNKREANTTLKLHKKKEKPFTFELAIL
jgi:hypothetical protein